MEETKFQTSEQQFPASTSSKRPSGFSRLVFIIIALAILGGIVFGAYKFLGSRGKKEEASVTPTPTEFVFPTDTPAPTPTPEVKPSPSISPTKTPTPKPSINPIDKTTGLDRSKLSIEILNGSGTAGVAKKAADILKNLGYSVTSTGNADNFNYETTTIEVKSTKSDYLVLLKKDLTNSYSIGTSSSTLSASVSADARIIVGK